LITLSGIAGAQGADCLVSPSGATVTCATQPLPTTVVFNVGVPAVTNPTSSFTTQWSLLSNTAGASIIGASSCGSLPGGATCPVTVQVTQVGSVIVRADIVITTVTGSMVSKNCQATLTVVDNGPPVITCPPNVNVECNTPTTPAVTGTATATDPCGGATVTFTDATTGSTCAGPIITRTWTATDPSGNTATCAQIITTVDTTPPLIACPGPVSVECFSLVPAPNVTLVTASDNCGGLVTVTHAGDAPSNGTSNCNNVITRTYVATDPCGNTSSCTQLITVNDTTPPTITCPGPAAVQCFSQVPLADPGSVATSDNCGGLVTVTHVGDSATNGTANCNVITRTYQATDPCGNTNTCTQTITVNDTVPPTITCPPDVNLPCGSPTTPASTGSATAVDNCDPNPAITWSDVSVGTCSPLPAPNPTNTVITRTWTATDSCNNTATCIQIITLVGQPVCVQPLVANLGGGCGVNPPQLSMTLPMAGGFVSLHVGSATPNSQLVVAAQLPPFGQSIPLPPPCALGVDVSSPATILMDQFATDSTGEWTFGFLLAPIPELANLSVRIQAGVFSPGGPLGFLELSDTIEGTIGTCPPCTASRETWAGNGPIGGAIYSANWLTLFPSGMTVGIYNPGNGATPPNGLFWSGDLTGQTNLHQFLGNLPPPGSTNSILFQDFLNPIASTQATVGSGSLARFAAVLQLNITFSAQGLLGPNPGPQPGIGPLVYMNPGDSLNGFTVQQILDVANQVLAGTAPLPAGYTLTTLAGLLENLSLSYENCIPSVWAGTHLFVATP
jgi:hypothetical protein